MRGRGCLNPGTPITYLDWIMEEIDFILVMSVNPGFGGQEFIPVSEEKIKIIREKIDVFSRKKIYSA